MPVDKFGRTDIGNTQRVISGGVTLSQVDNAFLRRDGVNAATEDINLGSHKIVNVLNPKNAQDAATKAYVDANKVSKTGDTMTGDLTLSIGADRLRTMGCTDLNNNSGFTIYLGNYANKIKYQKNLSILLETSDGLLCKHKGQDMVRFGSSSGNDKRTVVYHDLIMRNNRIIELKDPGNAQDAATKNYVDNTPKKNYVGYIPTLENNMCITGFVAEGSSVANDRFLAYGAFNQRLGSWLTAPNNKTGWLQIKCPERVRIWKVALKARNMANRNITSWNLSASNDGETFVELLSSATTLSGNAAINTLLGSASAPAFFDVITNESYQYYRFNITDSTGSNDVGVQLMQLYVYDD